MKENSSVLSAQIDVVKFNDVLNRARDNSRQVDEIVDSIVQQYCGQLDEYMGIIDSMLTDKAEPVTDRELEDFTLNLPAILYFTTSAMESLGIQEDVAKAIRSEVYNKVRELAEGTVSDKDTAAELSSQTETVVTIVYARAYKKVKLRVDAAYEMLNSVKKVMSRRISEMELSRGEGSSRPLR